MTPLVLITGAAGGLGRAVTERLQDRGWQLALVSRDAAGAMAWLLSDEAGWVTGQVLPVDGGFTAVRPMVKG